MPASLDAISVTYPFARGTRSSKFLKVRQSSSKFVKLAQDCSPSKAMSDWNVIGYLGELAFWQADSRSLPRQPRWQPPSLDAADVARFWGTVKKEIE